MLGLIRNHLEMSATLRRDIFDAETIRSFAGTVQTQGRAPDAGAVLPTLT